MLELNLSLLSNGRLAVCLDGQESHTAALPDSALFAAAPGEYGHALYQALFQPGTPAAVALHGLPLAPDPAGRLALYCADARLAGIPWEYLHNGQGWLALRYALVRAAPGVAAPAASPRLPGSEPANPPRSALFFVPADPLLHGSQPAPYRLAVEQEWDDLVADLRALDPACDLISVLPPTIANLQHVSTGARQAIVHFSGHGVQEERPGRAWLLFEQPSGAAHPVDAAAFADRLRGRVTLVVLSACQSATPGSSPEANLAGLLVGQGVPYALGMQFSVPAGAARQFSAAFYHAIFAGESVPEAVRMGRLALAGAIPEELLGIPVLYAADPQQTGRLSSDGQGLNIRPGVGRIDLSALPIVAHGFFGRQRELVEAGEWLTGDHPRQGETYPPLTVTLHGPGGIGKTALLRQAAARFAWRYPDGVLAISLEPLPPPAIVLERIERFCGLAEGATLPAGERGARLAEALYGRRLLLALDNFESVLHARRLRKRRAEAAEIFRFFSSLPARGVTLLVSSRQRTGLPGEQFLSVSDLDDLSGARLFRAGVSARRAELIDEILFQINRRVGGHPLALSLLGPIFDRGEGVNLCDFARRLDQILPAAAAEWDEDHRHDTLEACFRFSLDQFSAEDIGLSKAIARLSIFRSEFTTALAAPILSDTVSFDEEAYTVAGRCLLRLWERSLLERSLLIYGEHASLAFFRLHPAFTPFAAQGLTGKEKDVTENRYWLSIRHFAAIAHAEFNKSIIHAQTAWRVMPDLIAAANMREGPNGGLLRYHVAYLMHNFGYLEGALHLLQQALEVADNLGDKQGKAVILHEMATIDRVRGDLDVALQRHKESLEISEIIDDQHGKAATLHSMATIDRVRGDFTRAMQRYQQSLEIKQGLGDTRGIAVTLYEIATTDRMRNNLKGAQQRYQQLLKIFTKLGDLKGIAATLHEMATINSMYGDLERAQQRYKQALETLNILNDQRGKAATLAMLAHVQIAKQEEEAALCGLLEALDILQKMGVQLEAEQVAGILLDWRRSKGVTAFSTLWHKVTDRSFPEWLSTSPNVENQGEEIPVEELIHRSVQAERQRRPEAEVNLALRMATDTQTPNKIHELADVLPRILSGDFSSDLSILPPVLADLVQEILVEGPEQHSHPKLECR